jgi:hypothetical protein
MGTASTSLVDADEVGPVDLASLVFEIVTGRDHDDGVAARVTVAWWCAPSRR